MTEHEWSEYSRTELRAHSDTTVSTIAQARLPADSIAANTAAAAADAADDAHAAADIAAGNAVASNPK